MPPHFLHSPFPQAHELLSIFFVYNPPIIIVIILHIPNPIPNDLVSLGKINNNIIFIKKIKFNNFKLNYLN